MDYSVGSLSDLITGANTPNKKKVIKKKITQGSIEDNAPVSDLDTDQNQSKGDITVQKKKKLKKAKKVIDEGIEQSVPEAVTKKQKPQKRKQLVNDENAPEIKKSKNSENAERRVSGKEKKEKPDEDPELLARTVFVGNLPITSDTKKIKKLFKKYGNVESVRIRGVPVADPKTPKKVAIIKKEFHPERKSFYGFIRYEDRDSAIKATEANGILYKDHHLRVHLCDAKDKLDENKAIFVGNLSFYAEEDDLWKTFESCGPISSVRIVRDSRTGIGKGFGYVNFQNSDAVPLALEMENVKLKERELRISVCNLNAAKKNKKNNKAKKITKPGKPKNREKKVKVEGDGQENEKSENAVDKNEGFQGVKFIAKKKKKFNKDLLQKKKLVKKIAPK